MSQKPGSKTVLMIVGGLVAAIGIIAVIRYLKGAKPNPLNQDSIPNSTASNPAVATTASTFPLKNGSKNELVTQLQVALGVTADGAFGPKTQAALLAQTSKTSIATQAEFNTIIATLKNKPVVAAAKSRAESLTSQWQKNTALQLMVLSKVLAYQVVQDAAGALNPTGKSISLVPNIKLSRADYVPKGATTSGFLLFDITKGSLIGKYKVDASKITVA